MPAYLALIVLLEAERAGHPKSSSGLFVSMSMCTHMHTRIAPNTEDAPRAFKGGPGSKSWPEIVEQLTHLLGQPIFSAEIQVEGDSGHLRMHALPEQGPEL